jgi:hypothetical protein
MFSATGASCTAWVVCGGRRNLGAGGHGPGPISAVVLTMEPTGRDRSFIAPFLLSVVNHHAGFAHHRATFDL